MSTDNNMDQDQGGENEEDRSEQFFSPGHPATDQRQESQSQPPPTSSQENQTGQGGKQAKNKEKTPCLAMCGKRQVALSSAQSAAYGAT